MRYKVSKPEHGSQEWLTIRWQDEDGFKRIAASSAAAIYNQHPYMTAADLATELLRDTPPEPKTPTQAMERGNRLEPVIIDWVANLEEIVLHTPDELFCLKKDGARLIATIDAMDENGDVYEIKTMSKRWDGKLPAHWYWQGVQQAACVGVSVIHWRIFDSDMMIHNYTQKVSSDEIQMHINAVAEFLKSIDNGVLPDDVVLSYENASDLYNKPIAKQVILNDDAMDLIIRIEQIKVAKKEFEKLESEAKAELAFLMKDAEEAVIGDRVVATWKSQKRRVFDSARFESEHPALSEKYRKDTEFRVLKTKGKK